MKVAAVVGADAVLVPAAAAAAAVVAAAVAAAVVAGTVAPAAAAAESVAGTAGTEIAGKSKEARLGTWYGDSERP